MSTKKIRIKKRKIKTPPVKRSGELLAWAEVADPQIDKNHGDLFLGKPFLTLALGEVSSRTTGEVIAEITPDFINEMVRVFYLRYAQDPVTIDWNHNSSSIVEGDKRPEASGSLGRIIEMAATEEGLVVTPAYSERGRSLVESHQDELLYSSPEFLQGEIFSRDGGALISSIGQVLAVTLTPRPQQQANKIHTVKLSEKRDDMNETELKGLDSDALIKLVLQRDALVQKLEADIEQLKAASQGKADIDLAESDEDDEKKSMAESDEDEKKSMAESDEDDEKKSMAESDEDDEEKKKSSALTERQHISLMGEVKTLRTQLNEVLQAKRDLERDQAVNKLISTGRVTPAERVLAEEAWGSKQGGKSIFWKHLSERAPVINLAEIGHGVSGEGLNSTNLKQRINARAQADNSSFSEAMSVMTRENPTIQKLFL